MQTSHSNRPSAHTGRSPGKTLAPPPGGPSGTGTTRHSGGEAESIVLRMASSLSLDTARHPQARPEHLAHLGGAIALALSLGCLSEPRAVRLRTACATLLDGAIEKRCSTRAAVDRPYRTFVAEVRRNGGVSESSPPAMAELSRGSARLMLQLMKDDGLIGEPDIFGFHSVRHPEN
jgi:hypothetical protein